VPDVALEGDLDLEPLGELAVEVDCEGLGLLVGLVIAGLEVGMGEPAGKGQLGEQGVEIQDKSPAAAGERGRGRGCQMWR
jgi:hypothetical protein